MYSQNKEDEIVKHYFENLVGTCLSIGENNGIKFSNVFALIQSGWQSTLVEPSKNVFPELKELHKGNDKVFCIQAAIGNKNEEAVFYDSGIEEIHDGAKSLLATMSIPDKIKWEKVVEFTETKVNVITFDELLKLSPYKTFDFISLDAEGYDVDILRQMNLVELKCKAICIEHNGDEQVFEEIKTICNEAGLNNMLLKNSENVIWSQKK